MQRVSVLCMLWNNVSLIPFSCKLELKKSLQTLKYMYIWNTKLIYFYYSYTFSSQYNKMIFNIASNYTWKKKIIYSILVPLCTRYANLQVSFSPNTCIYTSNSSLNLPNVDHKWMWLQPSQYFFYSIWPSTNNCLRLHHCL